MENLVSYVWAVTSYKTEELWWNLTRQTWRLGEMSDANGVNEAVIVLILFFQKRLFSHVVWRHVPEMTGTTFRSPWKHANGKLRRQWRNPCFSQTCFHWGVCSVGRGSFSSTSNRSAMSENNNKPRPPPPTSAWSTCGCRSPGVEPSGLDVLLRIWHQKIWDTPEKKKEVMWLPVSPSSGRRVTPIIILTDIERERCIVGHDEHVRLEQKLRSVRSLSHTNASRGETLRGLFAVDFTSGAAVTSRCLWMSAGCLRCPSVLLSPLWLTGLCNTRNPGLKLAKRKQTLRF